MERATDCNSGAPAARRAAKRNPIIIEKGTTRMYKKRNPCNSFLMVKMASGVDYGRVRRGRRRRTTSHNMAAIQLIGAFRLEDEDDYEYEFSVLRTRTSKNVGLQTLYACSVLKTRTPSRPRLPI